MTWGRFTLMLILIGSLLIGVKVMRARDVARGDQQGAARVQAKWDAQVKVDLTESLRLQQEASAEQALKFRNAERISDEQAKREALREKRIADGSAINKRLLDTIDALDRRDVSQAGSDPRSIALAQSAATARELFGSCNKAQLDLAAEADRLRDQVAGLQDDAMFVCRGVNTQTKPDTYKQQESASEPRND